MKIGTLPTEKFNMRQSFLTTYEGQQPDWGTVGYVTYKRTYSRPLPNGESEEFWQTIQRVVEGVFTIQKQHYKDNMLPWDEEAKQERAEKMYEAMWNFKFLPPGRGLWAMGTNLIWLKGSAALNNCAFVSTENLDKDPITPFLFMMDMSMLGVGVGFDTKGAGKINIVQPNSDEHIYEVEDTREGWGKALRLLLEGYFTGSYKMLYNFSKIRPAGSPLKTMGGTAPGAQPLIDCIETLTKLLDSNAGKTITSELIVDIFNIVGKCVVSGGIRRTAQIAFGDSDDKGYLART